MVNGKVMEGDSQEAGSVEFDQEAETKRQTHDHFEEYLVEDQWSLVGADNIDPALQSFAWTARQIGLWFPNEKTSAKITCVAVGKQANPIYVSLLGFVSNFNLYLRV